MDSPAADWKNGDFSGEELETIDLDGRGYLPRVFRLPEYRINSDAELTRTGSFAPSGAEHSLAGVQKPNPIFKCFYSETWKNNIYADTDVIFKADESRELSAGRFAEYSFPRIDTGFVRTTLNVDEDAVIYVVSSEKRTPEKISYGDEKCDTHSIIKYRLPAGRHELESFECYSFMYIGILVISGKVSDVSFSIREYCSPVEPLSVRTGDETLDAILHASYEGFRQNTIDCFMDCPGRERGGWLCDSFFTGRTSLLFTGDTECEKAFLDNFRLAKFPKIAEGAPEELPEGLLPKCYPCNNVWNDAIPQWTMWFVMEVGEYAERAALNGNKDAAKPFEELIGKILGFFSKYENEDGLLKKLPYWNFVEWSRANEWVQDVNYPTNMLYAAMLDTVAKLYERPELLVKSAEIRRKIIDQSFDGEFFRDHAKRGADGKLEVLSDRSAICQHEAIMFGVASPDLPWYKPFIDSVVNRLGVKAGKSELPEDMEPLNLFIGYAVRILVMERLGEYDQALDEIKNVYGHMALETGTFWEHMTGEWSRNHGFGSFVSTVILDILKKRG